MNIIKKIKDDGRPVIIFGAGIVGEVLFHACSQAGIKVECFCDNNINKTKKPLCNIRVVPTPSLKAKYKEAVFLISAADIKDAVDQLKSLGYLKWQAGSLLLKDFDIYQYQFKAPIDFVEYAVATAILCHDNYLTPDKLFLRSVDIIITERCSLKCRDCSNLMQYYKNPVNCDLKELIKDIDRFLALADEVNEFRVLGGEPFMNKEAHLTIKKLIDEPKVKKIVIYTNGTIVPRENQIEYLKNNKVLFLITDYGELSRNLNNLIKFLKHHHIAYYAQKAQGWTDCAKIGRHYRSPEQQKEIFRNCCAKNTITLSDGKLYRCPFAANAARLQAVPDYQSDYIDIFNETSDINEMKNKIRKFFLEKDFLEACDYCNGRSFGDPEIRPAIQINKPLEYEKTIDLLESLISNPSAGLPADVFLFLSRITPMINVDLLIKNEKNHTLLTWRDDIYYGPGWHVPGGIIRYKETISDRIKAVAASELGANIRFKKNPLAINEIIHPTRRNRGHFISLLYGCRLISSLDENLKFKKDGPKPGQWAWHNKCPDNIISVHEIYREFIK